MSLRSHAIFAAGFALSLLSSGCRQVPGKPGPEPEASRPEQIVRFDVLYAQNCAGCHGSNGKGGAAISLNNPVYLATVGVDNIRRVTSEGVTGTMMPPFGKHAGGMLTDQQIDILAQGTIKLWSRPQAMLVSVPAYQSNLQGDPVHGQQAFAAFCARCHRADSLVDPAYLALTSDQNLRSTIIAGEPEQGMPDWRADGPQAMTDQEIANTVAWLASHRVATPGQPYQETSVSKVR